MTLMLIVFVGVSRFFLFLSSVIGSLNVFGSGNSGFLNALIDEMIMDSSVVTTWA